MSSKDAMDFTTMTQVQAQKQAAGAGPMPLDPEGRALAETKRFSLDIPEYVVKNDPLR